MKTDFRITSGLMLVLLVASTNIAQESPPPARGKQSVKSTYNALMQAAESGQAERVKSLIKRGANVNEKAALGETALMVASKRGQVEVIRILLAAGADPNAAGGTLRSGMFSVLTTAMDSHSSQRAKIIDSLLAAGADLNPKISGLTPLQHSVEINDPGIAEILIAKGAKLNFANAKGVTALMMAAVIGSPGFIQLLIAAGADVNLRDDNGNTALSLAKTFNERDPSADRDHVVRILKQAGAAP